MVGESGSECTGSEYEELSNNTEYCELGLFSPQGREDTCISTTKRCKLVADVHWIITTRGFTREGSLGYPASRDPTFPAVACYGSLNHSASIYGRG